ncbi:hypothetical protein, variant [Aphanomyces invadans]|uniref:Uncharacterized protein n=1 Tax=Aphanomyces invadans TaxID=157072 RepID=A0A024U7X0_9STRA|nr:hypothetical protein, variant [Aphanomyces invadans]ETW02354.1 hypothetical protein, variant [Aphanomyces invadans]|eukprot:XP_008868959.1 hypothetical protein, variant [Aphanomyces invadans]
MTCDFQVISFSVSNRGSTRIRAVYLNLAACHLALDNGDMKKVLEYCELALQIDKDNVKALYRKGQAYLNTNDLDAAAVVLKKAASLNPTDKAIRQAWTTCKERLEVAKAEDRKRWGGRLLDETSKKADVVTEDDDSHGSPSSYTNQPAPVASQGSSAIWAIAGLLPALAALVAFFIWGR